MTFLKFNSNASSGGLVGVIAYTGSIQHALGGLYRGGIRIFVLPVHQGFDAGLDVYKRQGLIQESASAPIPMRTMCITPQEPGIWQDILTEIPSVSRGKMRSSPRNPMTFPGAYVRN